MEQPTSNNECENNIPVNILIRKLLDNFPKRYSKYPRKLYILERKITVLDSAIATTQDEEDKRDLKKMQTHLIKEIVKILERVYC